MSIQTVILIFGSLGIGGFIGSYIQYLLNQRSNIKNQIRILNEDKYRSILVFMRCILEPNSVKQFGFNNKDENNLRSMDADEVTSYCTAKLTEYYYHSLLYASNKVVLSIENFIKNSTEDNFIEVANAMRKNLWGKAKINIFKHKNKCK